MRIVNLSEPGKISVEEMDYPVLQEGYAIVEVVYCGICGSDVSAFKGVNPTAKYPLEGLGHEAVGVIKEIGDNDAGLCVGDRVALEPYIGCTVCHRCQRGDYNNCTDLRVCGVHTGGMMRDYFSHPIRLVHKLPDDLSMEDAVLVEPFTIGLHAITRSNVAAGDFCLIFGSGIIGLMAAFGAKNRGATPLLVDMQQSRLDEAKEMGFEVFNSQTGDLEAYLKERTAGRMADVIVDCTGAPPVIGSVHLYAAYGARISLVGWPNKPVEINTIKCMQKEVSIFPVRNSRHQFPVAMELVRSGVLPVERLVTKHVPVEAIESTLDDIRLHPENYLKAVVDFK